MTEIIITQRKTVLDGVVLEEAYPAEPELNYTERLAIAKEQLAQVSKDVVDYNLWFFEGRVSWAEYRRKQQERERLFWDVEILSWKIICQKRGIDARTVQP